MEPTIDNFRKILQELKAIKEDEQLHKLDDNILFDGAVRIYNSMIINTQFQNRKQRDERREQTAQPQSMTEKQRQLLHDLEYKGNMNLTKAEATELISKFLEKRDQRQ